MVNQTVLLKLSGEQLGFTITDPITDKEFQIGFDPERARWLATEVKKLCKEGIKVVITIGGGNFLRGAEVKSNLIHHTTADQAGMMAINMNALLLCEAFNNCGLPTHAMTTLSTPTVLDDFRPGQALQDLADGKVVIIGGGTGQPGFSSDTGALVIARALDCGTVIKLTKVDGVYDSDPTTNPGAKKFAHITGKFRLL